MVRVDAIVVRDVAEAVIEQVEISTGHVGVTVTDVVGHGEQPGVTHEYRGARFGSNFLPKAMLTFLVPDAVAHAVADSIVKAARTGARAGDGVVFLTPVTAAWHVRTGVRLDLEDVR